MLIALTSIAVASNFAFSVEKYFSDSLNLSVFISSQSLETRGTRRRKVARKLKMIPKPRRTKERKRKAARMRRPRRRKRRKRRKRKRRKRSLKSRRLRHTRKS